MRLSLSALTTTLLLGECSDAGYGTEIYFREDGIYDA